MTNLPHFSESPVGKDVDIFSTDVPTPSKLS